MWSHSHSGYIIIASGSLSHIVWNQRPSLPAILEIPSHIVPDDTNGKCFFEIF